MTVSLPPALRMGGQCVMAMLMGGSLQLCFGSLSAGVKIALLEQFISG